MDVPPASTWRQPQSAPQSLQSTSQGPFIGTQDASQAHNSKPTRNSSQLQNNTEASERVVSSSSARLEFNNSQTFPISNGVYADVQNQPYHQNQRAQPTSWSIPPHAQSQHSQPPNLRWQHNSSQSQFGRRPDTSTARLAPHLRVLAPQTQLPSQQAPSLDLRSSQAPSSSSETSIHLRPLASQPISSRVEGLPGRPPSSQPISSLVEGLPERPPSSQPPMYSDRIPQTGQNSQQTMLSSQPMSHPRPHSGRKLYDPKTNELKPVRKPPVKYPTTVFTGPTHAQVNFLESLALSEIAKAEISIEELDEKENFRLALQKLCREAVTQHELERDKNFSAASVSLKCFGSLSTGFATHSSDMDLALVSPNSDPDMSSTESEIPRLLEKVLLDTGYGARLLTKTRIPIIKLCEKPTSKLRAALLEERAKWEEERDDPLKNPSEAHLDSTPEDPSEAPSDNPSDNPENLPDASSAGSPLRSWSDKELTELFKLAMGEGWYDSNERRLLNNFIHLVENRKFFSDNDGAAALVSARAAIQPFTEVLKRYRPLPETHLDFPKDGIGIQCDINFSNPLALHNTRLLRCYSLCDPRVRLIVIFVKAWAKQRRINSPYHGTLSSYGYVLMVLHYLANIVEPAIIPNLQQCGKAFRDNSPENSAIIGGYSVRFWRSETEIRDRARRRLMTKNHEDGIGIIICGFFHYFAHQNMYAPAGGFNWGQEVLSLRTKGGILRKKDKGWTGAKSTVAEHTIPGQEPKEIRHRYLLAIEDPFETDHNIARTVVHHGIISIRDEFRRAVSIIQSVGLGIEGAEELFAEKPHIPNPNPRRLFGPLPRKDDSATKVANSLETQNGGVPLPGSSKGDPVAPTDQAINQIAVGMSQTNINGGEAADRQKKYVKYRYRRGSDARHNHTPSGSSSHQPTSGPFSHQPAPM